MQPNTRRCLECNAKLQSRTGKKRRRVFTNLCQRCFTHPSDEHRCNAITRKGTRCAFRITGDSKKLCKLHASKVSR